MDLQTLKECWQASRESDALPQLKEDTVANLIEARAADLRRQLRARLRREGLYYIPLIAIAVAAFMERWTAFRVVYMVMYVATLIGLVGTLWRAERRVVELPLDRNLRDVLSNLLGAIDASGRQYVAAYVAVFVVFTIMTCAALYARRGVDVTLVAAFTLGVVATIWSYFSGRAYVGRMFRSSRREVERCLHELEG